MKLGRLTEFGDAQKIGIIRFLGTQHTHPKVPEKQCATYMQTIASVGTTIIL